MTGHVGNYFTLLEKQNNIFKKNLNFSKIHKTQDFFQKVVIGFSWDSKFKGLEKVNIFYLQNSIAKHNKISMSANSKRYSKMHEIKTIHHLLKHSLCRLIKTHEERNVTYALSLPIIELGFKGSYQEYWSTMQSRKTAYSQKFSL